MQLLWCNGQCALKQLWLQKCALCVLVSLSPLHGWLVQWPHPHVAPAVPRKPQGGGALQQDKVVVGYLWRGNMGVSVAKVGWGIFDSRRVPAACSRSAEQRRW